MRSATHWTLLTLLALALAALGSAACTDPEVTPPQEDSLTVEALSATVDLDLTYPDQQASVTLDADVRYEPADGSIFGGDYPVELSLLQIRDAAGDTGVTLGTGTLQSLSAGQGVSAGQTTKLYFYPEQTATVSELAALCDAGAVEVEITVAMPSCGCDAAVLTAPATLTCAEDRRASAQMALTNAGTPAGMPCTHATSASSFEDRYGYDADGQLLFRDVYDDDGFQSRMVYYWEGNRPTAVETIDATNGELTSRLTYTWDDAGRLVKVESRGSAPPYTTSASLYTYEEGDDRGWIRSKPDGTETQRATWDDATDQLVVRDTSPAGYASGTSSPEVRATFSGEYVREVWLASPEPLALASGKPVLFSAAELDGTPIWERTLTWDGDEISSDSTTITSGSQTGTVTTTWGYCH